MKNGNASGSWLKLAEEQSKAAHQLNDPEVARASASRAYYAVYSMVTARLHARGLVEFQTVGKQKRKNPDHASLPQLVKNHLTQLTMSERRDIAKQIIILRVNRETADYRPHQGFSLDMRLESMRSMEIVARLLA